MAGNGALNVVLGAGPVGRAVVDRLRVRDCAVRVVTRSGIAQFPPGVEVRQANVGDPGLLARACDGATVVYGCVGVENTRWLERWPLMMEGMLAGTAAVGARFVFVDNLYMYGPTDEVLTEDLPLTTYGRTPATCARLTRMWHEAHRAGSVQVAALRVSDFYGPGVTRSVLGEQTLGRIAQGKSVKWVGGIDQAHSVSYVPDVARALVSIGEADDEAMGQAWHVPNAPDRTPRQLLQLFAEIANQTLTLSARSAILLNLTGLVSPAMREFKEMHYRWNRPFRVDAAKFGRRFWTDATPFDVGMRATADWYRRRVS